MKAVELFAGVGGFRLGLEKAGHQVIWSNEWDKYAADTYDKNFTGKIDRRSITDVPAGDIPVHDLICGGFPCQAFSIAGKRKGFDETRGTLFFEIMRIARYHRTPYLFLENVKGLLNHDGGRTFDTIIRTLDELGYDCQWQVLNSKDFGVPQNRERIFIIGHLRGEPRPEVFPIGQSGQQDSKPNLSAVGVNNPSRGYEARTDGLAGTIRAGESGTKNIIQLKHSNDRVYGADGVAPTLNTMQGGNRQPFIATHYGFKDKPVEFHKISPTLKAQSHRHEPMVVERTPLRFLDRNQKNIEGDYSFTVDTTNTGGLKVDGRIRRLTPTECERLQGFPDGWTEGMSDTQRYKQMGNAVTVNVIEAIARSW